MNNFLSILSSAVVMPSKTPDWAASIPAAMKRRDPRIWHMAYTAAKQAIADADTAVHSVIAGTALGALDETKNFLDGVFDEGFGSPRNFIASVHNSMARKIALEFKIKGPNLTVCDGPNSFASALSAASILSDADFPALLLCIDEKIAFFDQVTPHLSDSCKNYLFGGWEEAAVAFIIDNKTDSSVRVRSQGPQLVYESQPEQVCRDLADNFPNASGSRFIFEKNSSSYIQPALTAYECIQTTTPAHVMIGSFSPNAGGAAVVELLKT